MIRNKVIFKSTLALILLSIFILSIYFVAFRNSDVRDLPIQDNVVENTPIMDAAPATQSVLESSELLINEPVLFTDIQYESPITYQEAIDGRDLMQQCITELEELIASDEYSDQATQDMQAEVERLLCARTEFEEDIDRFDTWIAEYPHAATVWFHLRSYGYSQEVTAGILGNMMVETSGGTLGIKPMIYDANRAYYGVCQWSLYYYPQARDLDLDGQLTLLLNTIEKEFKTFGFCYKSGFTYDDFLNLESPEDAALAFAKVYERCAKFSYSSRQRASRVAYEYFCTEEVQ